MKKALAFISVPVLLLCIFLTASAWAETLSAPQAPAWKAGSTATAVWQAVQGADYYQVRLHVSYRGRELGSVVTGTAATELDVQQEANSVLDSDAYDVLQLTYTVAAGYTDAAGSMVYGTESVLSPVWDYELTLVQLEPPENITLYEDGTITWQGVTGADHYSVLASGYAADPTTGVHTCQTTYPGSLNEDGLLSCNIKNFFDMLYKNIRPGQEQPITITVQLASWSDCSGLYLDSGYSQPTEAVEYVIPQIYQLLPPAQVTLSADGEIVWEKIGNADLYSVFLTGFVEGEPARNSSYQTTVPAVEDGNDMASCQMYEALCSLFKNLCGEELQPVVITAQVGAWTNESNPCVNSDYSAPSNEIVFNMPELTRLEPPANVQLDREGNVVWDSVPGADLYGLCAYGCIGDTMDFQTTCQTSYPAEPGEDGKETRNIMDFINDMYTTLQPDQHGSIHVCVQVGSWAYETSPYLNSEYSAYSNVVEYNPFKPVEAITLSPEAPILYVGNTLYMGKTITPEDAYYSHIDWQGGDEAVVQVSGDGLLTAVAPGVSEVTAVIGQVSQSAVVTVYDISSNIEDPEEQEAVTDEAGDIIDDLINSEDPDLGNTDIPEEDLDEIRQEVQEGIWRGDEMFTDIVWLEENFVKYKDNWGQIQKAARNLNAQFAGAYNIEVEMYHKDEEGKDYHIGNIIQLENEVTFTFDLPTGMKELENGYARKYVLVRIHLGDVDTVNVNVGEDSFSAKSDTFSDFVLLYVDTPVQPVDLAGMDTLVLPASTKTIGDRAFAGSRAEVVRIPKGCTAIGSLAFADCPNLRYVVLPPDADITIAEDAFKGSNVEFLYQ